MKLLVKKNTQCCGNRNRKRIFWGENLYGVTAPFYLAKLFQPYFSEGAAIVNISSSRDRMSQPQTESYTAAKGGISALTHALAVSLSGRVRVNSISPGWIDTDFAFLIMFFHIGV